MPATLITTKRGAESTHTLYSPFLHTKATTTQRLFHFGALTFEVGVLHNNTCLLQTHQTDKVDLNYQLFESWLKTYTFKGGSYF